MLATRIQIPIKVAYALTIHKSQGMTLKNVIVNCQPCFQPGQLGVAFGRAVSVAGLKIVNLSCCRNKNEIDNRIQILTQGLKLKIQIILHMMLNLLMRILIFQILKLINLNIWKTLLTIQAAECFSCNHLLLLWKMFLWNLWIPNLKTNN